MLVQLQWGLDKGWPAVFERGAKHRSWHDRRIGEDGDDDALRLVLNNNDMMQHSTGDDEGNRVDRR